MRARMVEAARARITAGDLDLPMNAIAKDAGVGVGTMYRHFASRQALLETVAADHYAALIDEARAAAENPDAAAGLSDLLRAVLRCQLTDAALAEVMALPRHECPETLELGSRLTAESRRVLERAREAGAIRPDVTGDDIRRLTCGVRYAVASGEGDPTAAADRYLDVVLRGLRP
ncbi:TetR/AcrR family transcriptional regulator [Cryptosporangium japonicum]|uniref:TetR/AcrR family transcriptional regulator n=1 Tax=Cryptosporangium japonicum TaxID=80872 RepID=A0ABN0U493_9ACTN